MSVALNGLVSGASNISSICSISAIVRSMSTRLNHLVRSANRSNGSEIGLSLAIRALPVLLALVLGTRQLISGNCQTAVEFQSARDSREVEDYQTELGNVAILELTIVPDIGVRTARASVKSLRLG